MRLTYWSAIAVTGCVSAVLFSYQPGGTSAPIAVDPASLSLRVRFGVTDEKPLAWDGQIAVEGGEVLQLRSWHPRPGDAIQGTQSWKLSTRSGPNFVRRPVEEDQVFPPEPYLWDAGLIVDLKANSGTRVTFRTAQGEFEVRPASVPATGVRFLNGRVAVERVSTAASLSPADRNADFAAMLGGKDGEVWAAWVSYSDKQNDVVVRRFDGN